MIYLDYQATTPLAPEALAAMLPWLGGPGTAAADVRAFANPHSPHAPGRAAAAAVAHARDQVAALFPPGGRVVFTSGATEALGAAILALVEPGDEVIVFTPAYDSYVPMIRRAGGAPVEVALQPPGWRIDGEALDAAVSSVGGSFSTFVEAANGTIAQALAAAGRGVAVVSDDPRFDLVPLAIDIDGKALSITLFAAWDSRSIAAPSVEQLAGRLAAWVARRYGPEPGGGQRQPPLSADATARSRH